MRTYFNGMAEIREQADRFLPHLTDTRNHQIARRVMLGETYSSVARDFDIGPERVRGITHKVALEVERILNPPPPPPPRPMPPDNHICYLEISLRAYNCLVREEFETVDDIANLTFEDFMGMRACGEKTAREIIEVRDRALASRKIVA